MAASRGPNEAAMEEKFDVKITTSFYFQKPLLFFQDLVGAEAHLTSDGGAIYRVAQMNDKTDNTHGWLRITLQLVRSLVRLDHRGPLLKIDKQISGTIYRPFLAVNEAQGLEGVRLQYASLDPDFHY